MYGHERSLVENMNGRPFVLLGVNSDKKKSRVETAMKKNNLNWRSFWDGSKGPIAKSFKIRGWPTIFLIDHRGVIQAKNLRGSKLDIALAKLVARAEEDGATGDPAQTFWRTFTDSTGKYEVEAKFVKFEDGKVTLIRKDNDKEIELDYDRLSKDDQAYAREQRRRIRSLSKTTH